MARLVKKDTYLYEDSGAGNMVRRQVFAGQFVPNHYVAGDDTVGGALDEVEAQSGPGLGAGAAEYPFNRGVSVREQLQRRGLDSSDDAAHAVAAGGQARLDFERKARSKQEDKPADTGGQVGNDETEIQPSGTPEASNQTAS